MNATAGTTAGQQEVPADESSPADAADGTGDARATLPEDDLFHLLQNYRRRAVVRYLRGREGPVEMRDVAEQVAAWEHDTTLQALTSDERQRVYIALYQSHLETLEDAGVIEYNKPRGVVEPTPLLDHVASYLDVADGDASEAEETSIDRDWSLYYLVASGASTLLFGSTAFGGALSAYLSSALVSLFTVAAFSAITTAMLLTDLFGRGSVA